LTEKSTTIIELKTSLPPRSIKDEKDETSSSYRPWHIVSVIIVVVIVIVIIAFVFWKYKGIHKAKLT
ncbi:hypothetical protein GWI33_009465, partial [Rhynchophorus ferrugineus]